MVPFLQYLIWESGQTPGGYKSQNNVAPFLFYAHFCLIPLVFNAQTCPHWSSACQFHFSFPSLELVSGWFPLQSLWSGKLRLPVFACLSLQLWGQHLCWVHPFLKDEKGVVDFSVCIAYCLLGWCKDFQKSLHVKPETRGPIFFFFPKMGTY